MITSFPAYGWIPPGLHFDLLPTGEFATLWQGPVQAPGNGECVVVLSDPRSAIVRIDSGAWGGHEYYLGLCTPTVIAGERFAFGHVLGHADQDSSHDPAEMLRGWVDFRESFATRPAPDGTARWFDQLLATPLILRQSDGPSVYGDRGVRVLAASALLADCGYLPRGSWRFDRRVHDAVVRFRKHHNLPANHGVVDARAEVVLAHASEVCRRTRRKEV